jgi:hypothetical protein
MRERIIYNRKTSFNEKFKTEGELYGDKRFSETD